MKAYLLRKFYNIFVTTRLFLTGQMPGSWRQAGGNDNPIGCFRSGTIYKNRIFIINTKFQKV